MKDEVLALDKLSSLVAIQQNHFAVFVTANSKEKLEYFKPNLGVVVE